MENYFRSLFGHASVLSPSMYYPATGVLGYSSGMAADALVYIPFRILHLGLFTSYQLSFMACDTLAFLFCFLLLKKGFGLSPFASSVGSGFFTFNSIKYHQLFHFDHYTVYLFPLMFFFIIWVIRNSDRLSSWKVFVYLTISSALLGLQLLTSFYLGWFSGFWFLIFLILVFAHSPSRVYVLNILSKHRWGFIGAFCSLVISLVPCLYVYLPVLHLKGPRGFGGAAHSMAPPRALLWMGPYNYVWGWLSKFHCMNEIVQGDEQYLGLGLIFTVFWEVV